LALRKDQGIVIYSINYGETDKLISILSQSEPRRTYYVRGIRKSKKRPISATEIGSLVELDYYDKQGSEWNYVKEIVLLERFDSIKSSVSGLYFLAYITEILNYLLPEGEKHEKEAQLIQLALFEVEQNGFHYGILPFLKIRLLKSLGIVPIDFLCSDCGEEVYPKQQAEVSINLEIHCGDCRTLKRNDIELIRFLRDCMAIQYSKLFSKIIPEYILFNSDRLLNQFLNFYIRKELKTEKDFYKLIRNELNV